MKLRVTPTPPPPPRLRVGDDISSARNDIHFLSAQGDELVAHQAYANDRLGYQQLRDDVLDVLQQTGLPGVDFAGEATGWYWFHTFYALAHDPQLAAYEPRLTLYNPRQTHAFKKALGSLEHTDPQDADVVAQRVHFQAAKYRPVLDDVWLGRRILTRHHSHVSHALAAEKTYFSTFLYLKASAYRQVKPFGDVYGQTSALVLSQYDTIQELADIPLADLEALLRTWSDNHLPHPADNARRLHEVAQRSFVLPPGMVAPVNFLLESSLAHIRFLEQQRQATRAAIEQAFEGVPELDVLDSLPGVGCITAAGVLAEISPWRRFLDGQIWDRQAGRNRPKNARDAEAAIAKWGGLWWPRHDSGNLVGEITRMSKEGNSYLRYYLIQIANCLKEHAAEFAAYYQRKRAESPKHAHMRALVLTARKAVGPIVALLHTGRPYRTPEAYRNVLSPHQARRRAATSTPDRAA